MGLALVSYTTLSSDLPLLALDAFKQILRTSFWLWYSRAFKRRLWDHTQNTLPPVSLDDLKFWNCTRKMLQLEVLNFASGNNTAAHLPLRSWQKAFSYLNLNPHLRLTFLINGIWNLCPPSTGDSCGCGLTYTPVCGGDSQTYGNACIAKCMNQNVVSQGECTPCADTSIGSETFPPWESLALVLLNFLSVFGITICHMLKVPSNL